MFKSAIDKLTVLFFPCELKLRAAFQENDKTHRDAVASSDAVAASYKNLERACSGASCPIGGHQ